MIVDEKRRQNDYKQGLPPKFCEKPEDSQQPKQRVLGNKAAAGRFGTCEKGEPAFNSDSKKQKESRSPYFIGRTTGIKRDGQRYDE